MNASTSKLTLECYETNVGYFVRVAPVSSYHTVRTVNDLKGYFSTINDIPCSDLTMQNGFFKLDGKPEKIEKLQSGSIHTVGYKLKDDILKDKLPTFLTLQEVPSEWDEDDNCSKFVGKYAQYMPFYEAVLESKDDSIISVEFEVKILGNYKVSDWQEPSKMQVKLQNEGFSSKSTPVDLKSIVHYDDIEKILTPEFMLHTRPCELSSHQVYRIVRAHIIENIDPKKAKITSNYDFCFTVKKLVVTEPYSAKMFSVVGRGKSKEKTVVKEVKEVDFFEMTWEGYDGKKEGYKGYTPIKPWKANSLKELQEHIKEYLDSLMQAINAEVHECKHCAGLGFHVQQLGTNDRK